MGRIAFFKHTPGQYLNAMRADCAQFNENVLIGMEAGEPMGAKIGVRLIAGLIARRIVPWVAAKRHRAARRTHQPDSIRFARGCLFAQERENQSPAWRPCGRRRIYPRRTRLNKMAETDSKPPAPMKSELKIYFLPNLLTAGNLFCGFVALTKIVEADLTPWTVSSIGGRSKSRLASSYLPAFLICLTAASRAWADMKVRLAANLIRWPTWFPSASRRHSWCIGWCCMMFSPSIRRVRLVHRVHLSDLRRVSSGALQLPLRHEPASAPARIFSAFPFPPPPAWSPR